MFVEIVFEILKLYIFLYIVIIWFVKLFMLSPVVFNFLFLFVLYVGICFDNRFRRNRRIFFFVFCIIQVLLYYFLDIITIIFVKDLFWFSCLLNIGFIWHVLILNWCYIIAERCKWDYVCYIISRWSLLTSLTGVKLAFQELYLISTLGLQAAHIYNYYLSKDYRYVRPKGWDLIFWRFVGVLGDDFLAFIIYVLEYFSSVFNNYCKLLLGKNNKFNIFRLPIRVYIFFIFTFSLSFWLMIPRLYIIWFILLLRHIIPVWWEWGVYPLYLLHWKFYEELIKYFHKLNSKQHVMKDMKSCHFRWDVLIADWQRIYDFNFFKEYIPFSYRILWNKYDGFILNVHDVLRLFIYRPDRQIKLLYTFFFSEHCLTDHEYSVFFNVKDPKRYWGVIFRCMSRYFLIYDGAEGVEDIGEFLILTWPTECILFDRSSVPKGLTRWSYIKFILFNSKTGKYNNYIY